jgi:hypothetical protein
MRSMGIQVRIVFVLDADKWGGPLDGTEKQNETRVSSGVAW